MSFDFIYFFATLQPLPIVQTIIIFHLTTPGARDRFPTHTVVPLWSILQKLAAWFILTQIKLLWWTVRCSIPILLCCLEVGNDVSPSRVTLAAKNCLAPSHIPSWGGSYPMMVQCEGLNTQPSQHHWDHSGEPLLPVRSAKAVMGPQPQITSSLCPILFPFPSSTDTNPKSTPQENKLSVQLSQIVSSGTWSIAVFCFPNRNLAMVFLGSYGSRHIPLLPLSYSSYVESLSSNAHKFLETSGFSHLVDPK